MEGHTLWIFILRFYFTSEMQSKCLRFPAEERPNKFILNIDRTRTRKLACVEELKLLTSKKKHQSFREVNPFYYLEIHIRSGLWLVYRSVLGYLQASTFCCTHLAVPASSKSKKVNLKVNHSQPDRTNSFHTTDCSEIRFSARTAPLMYLINFGS